MKKLIYLFVGAMLVSGCFAKHRGLTADEQTIAKGLEGQIYYTQINIAHKYTANKISSKNLHEAEMLPLGTKVTIEKCGDAEIKFSDDSGKAYALVLSRNSPIDLMTLFNRYFSKENIMADGGRFYKFTKQEQENIKKGIVDYNMSKEAVIMSYGYPTPNKGFTPDIKSSKWQYLESSLQRTNVYFRDNKIVKIEDIQFGRKRPGRRAKRVTVRENKSQVNASAQNGSDADELLKYNKLLDSGAITKEEYEQKKKQLLGL